MGVQGNLEGRDGDWGVLGVLSSALGRIWSQRGEFGLSPRQVYQRGGWRGHHPPAFGVLVPPLLTLSCPPVRYGRFDPEDQRSRHCPYLDTINK